MRDLYEDRKKQFKAFVNKNKRLPNTWDAYFIDGEDMRIWYDSLLKTGIPDAKEFVSLINNSFNVRVLNKIERELELIEFVRINEHIPVQNEFFFSDGVDAFKWLYPVREDVRDFVKFINNLDQSYFDLDIAMYVTDFEKDINKLVKEIKRLPKYGEKKLLGTIDARCVINKLMTLHPEYVEKLLLHIESYNKDNLDVNARVGQYLMKIDNLGYEPALQECRFTDGTDMYTWSNKYKKILAFFDEEIDKRVINEYKRK